MMLRIHNRQAHPVSRTAVRQLILQYLALSARRAPARPWRMISVVLSDDTGILPVKQAAFGVCETTDVVALTYDPIPGEEGLEGEVFVNVERALDRPCRPGWTPAQELALYLAHGIDHLYGADDRTPAGRRQMRRREQRWMRTATCRIAIERLLA